MARMVFSVHKTHVGVVYKMCTQIHDGTLIKMRTTMKMMTRVTMNLTTEMTKMKLK